MPKSSEKAPKETTEAANDVTAEGTVDFSSTPTSEQAPNEVERRRTSENIVKDHMLVALGVGLIPVPGIDLGAGFVSQLVMIRRICKTYGVKFSSKATRAIVLTLCSGLSGAGASVIIASSIAKLIPGAGTTAGAIAMPVSTAALTHALGSVFIAHFELGGTLSDFNATDKTGYFQELYRRGESVAKNMKARRSEQAADEADVQSAASV